MREVVIVSVSAGSGHVRSAQALESAFQERHPDVPVRHVDALKYTSKAFSTFYAGSYLKMANDMPTLWGYLFKHTDRRKEKSKLAQLLSIIQKMNATRLFKLINNERPGFILCTHFLPMSLILPFIRKKKMKTRLGVVVTDYDMHSLWYEKRVHKYFVATEAISYKLMKQGMASNRISVSGIPIHPVFSKSFRKGELLKKFGLKEQIPKILIVSGGFGDHQIRGVLEAVMNASRKVQILAVAGKSKKVKKIFDSIEVPEGVTFRSFGLVSFIEELMEVADIAITKSGGLVTAECLAKGLPMLVFSPIPGQEERNCDYLQENNAGMKVQSVVDMEFKLKKFFEDEKIGRQLRRGTRKIARPDAAYVIADEVCSMIAGKKAKED